MVYSAHPFLREFFRSLLSTEPESVHESVRTKLAPGLIARPVTHVPYPKDPAILDRYELLIEHTLLAGHLQEAWNLYRFGLGSHGNLGSVLGENGRGLRILEYFVPHDDFSRLEPDLPLFDRGDLINDLGLFAHNVGDLDRARQAIAKSQRLAADASDQYNASQSTQNLAWIELTAGHFRQALEHSQSAVSLAVEAKNATKTISSLAHRATSHFALGDITAAAADFLRAAELNGTCPYSLGGIQEAEYNLFHGDRLRARSQTQANREWAVGISRNDDLCRCNSLLARLLLPNDPARAGQHLQDARAFANRCGNVEFQLRCFHAACELHLHLGDFPQAIAEAEAGILLADTCGFGKFSIDLRLALVETLLAAGDARQALQNALDAIDRSEHPVCQYAWGKTDGLHFCGLAHLRLGEHELARRRLIAALEVRQRFGHGRIEETRRALALCRP